MRRGAPPEVGRTADAAVRWRVLAAFVAAVLIAVNASEFFTQDAEDFSFGARPAGDVTDSGTAGAPAIETPAQDVSPANAQAPASNDGADENLDERIRAACRDLGKTEAQLVEWLGKKYGADAVESLTVPDKREVLEFLSSRASRRAA